MNLDISLAFIVFKKKNYPFHKKIMRAPIFQTCSLQFHTYLSPPPHSFLEGAQHITRLLLGVHYATGRSLIQKIFKYPFNAISLLVYQLYCAGTSA